MTLRFLKKAALSALAALSLPTLAIAQSADDVKLDVLSALSTPLPITVVGPLLTRDVVVTEEGDGFRATLQDSTLLGLFPFGDVSMKLVPLDDDTYQVSDLQLPRDLDFPGLGRIAFSDMTLNGTWSASDRSYSDLQAELTGLRVEPGQGALTLGRLAFDVQKEPDETDTESRFNITLGDVSAAGFAPINVTLGEAQILLSANGERPVDLYSLLREVILVAGMRDGGIGLQTLGQSLLGNTYGTIALDLQARDLNVVDFRSPDSTYLLADGMQARLGMEDVSPRDWGAAELSVTLDGVEHQDLIESGMFDVSRAVVRLGAEDLPVADMFAAAQTLATAGWGPPILVSDLLDGFAEFGALELSTEGEALSIEVRDSRYVNDEWVEDTAFFSGYDDWNVAFSLTGLNENQGVASNLISLSGGRFTPGELFREQDLRHVEAWFPTALRIGGQVSNLNEAFLKRLFKDVYIADLTEPVELIMPLMLYASASVFDVTVPDNHYETSLFRLEQRGEYRVYPAKFMSLAPFEGRVDMSLTGFDALFGYMDETIRLEAAKQYGNVEELSILKSVVTVMRNLGAQGSNGEVTWEIEKPDADRSELTINGTTLYYPEINQFLPFAFLGSLL